MTLKMCTFDCGRTRQSCVGGARRHVPYPFSSVSSPVTVQRRHGKCDTALLAILSNIKTASEIKKILLSRFRITSQKIKPTCYSLQHAGVSANLLFSFGEIIGEASKLFLTGSGEN